jgi:hypothetical protein
VVNIESCVVPGQVGPPIAVLNLPAKVVGLAADQELFGERGVAVAITGPFQQPQRGAGGEEKVGRPLGEPEFGLRTGDGEDAPTGEPTEEIELNGSGERLEAPETGHKVHQRRRRQHAQSIHHHRSRCVRD